MRKAITIALLLLAIPAALLAIGQARMTGKVVDPEGKPIKGSTITLVATEAKTFKETFPVKDNGEFSLAVVDGTIHYEFTVSAPGYPDYKEVIKMKLVPEKNERTFTLAKGTVVTSGIGVGTAAADPATKAYNEGAELYNAGKVDEALAKFQEAVKAKPELSAGYMAMAKLYMARNEYQKAIDNAEKALSIVMEDDQMFSILAVAYEKVGNKAKAAEYKEKAPKSASQLYNDAVTHLNAGRDTEAEPLLKKSIELDPAFGDAYYQLGMVYVRLGKNADAKATLQKYMEVDPKGKDVPLAKEVMKYLN